MKRKRATTRKAQQLRTENSAMSKTSRKNLGAVPILREQAQREDRLFYVHFAALNLSAVLMGIIGLWDSPRANSTSFWLWATPAFLVGMLPHLANSLRPFSVRLEERMNHPAYIRQLKRRLAADALLLSLVIAALLYVSGATEAFGGLLMRWSWVGPKIGSGLATVASWLLSGIIGNFCYDLLKKIFITRASPTGAAPRQRSRGKR